MIIGDGDNTRALRYNIFNPAHVYAGIWSGTHAGKGHQTCVAYAETYEANIDTALVNLTEAEYRTLDDEIFAEINKVRDDPTYLVPILEAIVGYYDGTNYKEPGKFERTTEEGVTAVNEAIAALNAAS